MQQSIKAGKGTNNTHKGAGKVIIGSALAAALYVGTLGVCRCRNYLRTMESRKVNLALIRRSEVQQVDKRCANEGGSFMKLRVDEHGDIIGICYETAEK